MNTWKFALYLIFFLFSVHTYGQIDEYKLKAAFIERFTRFIEWPSDEKKHEKDDFVITVYGKNPFGGELKSLFSKVKIKNTRVKIYFANSLRDIKDTDILYIAEDKKDETNKIIEKFQNKPVLIIGDSPGMAHKGIHINMFIDNKKINFEINEKAFEKTGLKIDYHLLQYGRVVKNYND